MSDPAPAATSKKIKRENFLVNLLFNIVLPIMALKQLSGEERLGPVFGLAVAVAFPICYFAYDFAQRRNANIISIFGFLNILLTGSIGLLEADAKWVAVKEAAVPALIGVMFLCTGNSRKSLLKTFLFNDQIFDTEKIQRHIDNPRKEKQLKGHFKVANTLLVFSFLISSVLNYILASQIVKSPGGTEAFNNEMATLTWVSYIVIAIPSLAISVFALWRLIKGLKELTGLDFMGLLHEEHAKAGQAK